MKKHKAPAVDVAQDQANEEDDGTAFTAPTRLVTGIDRLDDILSGGLLRGRVYLIGGVPGSGKTVFGNQICFARAGRGDESLFVTLLAESHARMLSHIQGMSFFDASMVGAKIHYLNAFGTLEKKSLGGVRDLLRKLMTQHDARLLILDGIHALRSYAANENAYQRFIRELQTIATFLDCTVVMLTPTFSEQDPSAAMVDGVIELSHHQFGPRAVRELTVHKFRGSPCMLGRHEVEITDRGIIVHPRTEIAFATPPERAGEDRVRVTFGVPALDAMLGGGVLSSSTTMLLGAPGTGKTILGLKFLAEGASRGEPGVYFGFYETPPRLMEKARSLGIALEEAERSGSLEIQWQPPLETNLDSLAERLLERIRERKVDRLRLFVDGIAGFRDAAAYPIRLRRFFAALTHQLRELDVTTVISEETPLFHAQVELPNEDFASVVENIVLLRHVEHRSELRRLIAILKSRESEYDPHIREFFIDRRGISVADSFDSATRLLDGNAQLMSGFAPARRRAKAATKTRAATKTKTKAATATRRRS